MTATSDQSRTYAPGTAGAIMATQVPVIEAGETVMNLRLLLQETKWDSVDPVIVTDDGGFFTGALSMAQLVAAPDQTLVGELADPDWPCVTWDVDQESVANIARSEALSGVPVLDTQDNVLGCVSATMLLDVLWHEHTEDVHRLAGIIARTESARHALTASPVSRAWRRLPWLLLGVAGSAVATGIMAGFEAQISADVRIAFFVPALVYLADAVGTQSEAVTVRALATGRIPLGPALRGELATGALIGVVLSAFAFAGVMLGFADADLAAAVALAVFAAGGLATGIGFGLPCLLERFGIDPAFGSGPLATIAQDVLSILVYFAVALAVL